jgi:hypothetical protein
MLPIVRRVVAGLVPSLLGALLGTAHAAPVAEVIALKGSAVVVAQGRQTPLAVGQMLDEGQQVQSQAPGRVKLRFVDGSVMVIGDSSTLRIEKFRPPQGSAQRVANFALDVGLISQTVAPATPGSWTVRTSSVVTAVRGTEYLIEVKPDQRTEVSVRSGAVAVESTPAAQQRRRTRIRGMSGQPEAAGTDLPQPVVLDRSNAGTTCNAEGVCDAAKPWSAERLQQINDRLSGV